MLLKLNANCFNKIITDFSENEHFIPLLTYLNSHELITLRDIKRTFPDVTNLEHMIDVLVDEQVIKRYHGKYSLKVPVVNQEVQQTVNHTTMAYLEDQKRDIKNKWLEELELFPKEGKTMAMLCLLSNTVSKAEPLVIYEQSSYSERWLSEPLNSQKIEGKLGTWVSFDSFLPSNQVTIPSFFNLLQLPTMKEDEMFQSLYSLIGDVNQTYYFSYVERKMRRLLKNKKLSAEKPDIFMTSLELMDYIKEVDGYYQAKVIQIGSLSEELFFIERLDKLVAEMDFVAIPKSELIFMINCILYNWLIEESVLDSLSVRYGIVSDKA